MARFVDKDALTLLDHKTKLRDLSALDIAQLGITLDESAYHIAELMGLGVRAPEFVLDPDNPVQHGVKDIPGMRLLSALAEKGIQRLEDGAFSSSAPVRAATLGDVFDILQQPGNGIPGDDIYLNLNDMIVHAMQSREVEAPLLKDMLAARRIPENKPVPSLYRWISGPQRGPRALADIISPFWWELACELGATQNYVARLVSTPEPWRQLLHDYGEGVHSFDSLRGALYRCGKTCALMSPAQLIDENPIQVADGLLVDLVIENMRVK